MSIMVTTEKQFEFGIEAFLISDKGGYTKGNGTYDSKLGVYPDKLISFIKRTQPREWAAFERQNAINDGVRIIVTTLQKFPVIYTEVDPEDGSFHPFHVYSMRQGRLKRSLFLMSSKII